MNIIDRSLLIPLLRQEIRLFVEKHPYSIDIVEQKDPEFESKFLKVSSVFPIYFNPNQSTRQLVDVDGNEYIDFRQSGFDISSELCTRQQVLKEDNLTPESEILSNSRPDTFWVFQDLRAQFGLRNWNISTTTTEANNFLIRSAQEITKRKKILVFQGHTGYFFFHELEEIGDNHTQEEELVQTIPFNDIQALKEALETREVAAVVTEPAFTSEGLILPKQGFIEALREYTKKTGTLLIFEETNTICMGPGGATKKWNLKPDAIVIGYIVNGGNTVAAFGYNKQFANHFSNIKQGIHLHQELIGYKSKKELLSAMRKTLTQVFSDENFEKAIKLAQLWAQGVQDVIDEFKLPWSALQVGCLAEYWFSAVPPLNRKESRLIKDRELETYLQLFCLNRGILITPVLNMAFLQNYHTQQDVDQHSQTFYQAIKNVVIPLEPRL